MIKICIHCGTQESKKWYNKDGGYLCQKDYRRSRYIACQEQNKIYQKEYYNTNKEEVKAKILKKYHDKKPKLEDGKCHQKIIKDNLLGQDLKIIGEEILNVSIDDYILLPEKFSKEHREFIETYEWLGSVGNSPKWVFTARYQGLLAGVILFNEPNCYSKNILSIDTKKMECLIQRGACSSWAHKHLGSKLIRFACNWLAKNTAKKIFIAYSDPRANEIGTIYQACGFDYLGQNFGARQLLEHPTYNNKKLFTVQSLRRTSSLRAFLKRIDVTWEKIWEKPNGYKDLSKIPKEYKEAWTNWIHNIIYECKKIKLEPKGKYVLILGKDRREQRQLHNLKSYIPQPYPKRK
jgi:hypothetical protein